MTVPSTWASPVIVPISWVESLTSVVVVASAPSVAIVDYTNLPNDVPSSVVASVPSV